MRTLTVFLLLATAAVATAQPSLTVTPASIEVGRIGPTRIDTTVVIANRGSAPIVVQKIATSCGCTTTGFAARTLNAGDTAHVRVTVDARHKTGDFRTSLTIISNDAANPNLPVPMHGTVARAATLPEFIGPAQDAVVGRSHEISMQVKNISSRPLTLSAPTVADANGLEASVAFTTMTIPVGETRAIPVQVTARKAGAGQAVLTIRTDDPFQPELAVGIHTNVASDARTTATH